MCELNSGRKGSVVELVKKTGNKWKAKDESEKSRELRKINESIDKA